MTTNKEKIDFILQQGLSSKTRSTLERKSGEWLDFLINNGREPTEDELSANDRQATSTFINQLLDLLDIFKKARVNEPLDPTMTTFARKNSEEFTFMTEKNNVFFKRGVFAFVLGFLCIDSIIGWDTLKEKIVKWLEKRRLNKQFQLERKKENA